MILLYGLTLLALLGRVEPLKLSFKSPAGAGEATDIQQPIPPPHFAPQAYPIVQQQEAFPERDLPSGVKGGAAPLPERPLAYRQPEHPQYFVPIPQPQTLAYVIIRPIQGHYQYPFGSVYQQPTQSFYQQTEQTIHQSNFGTKGGDDSRLQPAAPVEQAPIKSPEPGVLHSGPIEAAQPLPPPPPPPAPAAGLDVFGSLDAKKQGKLSKLKSHLEQFAASAKSKLTLGSSYQFVNEEIVPSEPQPPAPQLQQQPIEQVKIQQQQQQQHVEQESLRENEPLEQQKELPKVEQQTNEQQQLTNAHENEFRREQTRITGQQVSAAAAATAAAGSSKGRNAQ